MFKRTEIGLESTQISSPREWTLGCIEAAEQDGGDLFAVTAGSKVSFKEILNGIEVVEKREYLKVVSNLERLIHSLLSHAFKSLTVSQIRILELDNSLLKVEIVAEGYKDKNIPERVEILTKLLREYNDMLSNYAIAFIPVTHEEYIKGEY